MALLVSSTLDVLAGKARLAWGRSRSYGVTLGTVSLSRRHVYLCTQRELRRGYGPWVCLNDLILRQGAGVWAVSAFGRLATVYLSGPSRADGDQAPQCLKGWLVESWCSRQDSNLQLPRSKRGTLYIELREHHGRWISEVGSEKYGLCSVERGALNFPLPKSHFRLRGGCPGRICTVNLPIQSRALC